MAEHTEKKPKRNAKTLPVNRLKKEQMTSVVWTTPLGLPIVQPYRKANRKQVMTSLQTVFISDPNSPAEGELVSLPNLFWLMSFFILLISQFCEAGFSVSAKFHTQFGCYTYDANSS
jgi:hypothetical protein